MLIFQQKNFAVITHIQNNVDSVASTLDDHVKETRVELSNISEMINNLRNNDQFILTSLDAISATIESSTQAIIQEFGAASHVRLTNNIDMMIFWKKYFKREFDVLIEKLVALSILYMKEENLIDNETDEKCYRTELIKAFTLIDGNKDGKITVEELNMAIYGVDEDADMMEVIDLLMNRITPKLLFSLEEYALDSVIWDTNPKEGIMSILRSYGNCTIIYGPEGVGKTFLCNIAAHDLEDDEAIIWLDIKNMAADKMSILPPLADQLDVLFTDVNSVVSELDNKIVLSQVYSKGCTVVIDHVDIEQLLAISDMIAMLDNLRETKKLSLILISTSTTKPNNMTRKLKLKSNKVNYHEIKAFTRLASLSLTTRLSISEPELVVDSSHGLPGRIMFLGYRKPEERNAWIDDEGTPSEPSTWSPSCINFTDGIEFDRNSKLLIRCLYYPLSNGLPFSKSLAKYLCREVIDVNPRTWMFYFEQAIEKNPMVSKNAKGFYMMKSDGYKIDPVDENDTITRSSQMKLYYWYLVEKIIEINNKLKSSKYREGIKEANAYHLHLNLFFTMLEKEEELDDPWCSSTEKIEMVKKLSVNIGGLLNLRFGNDRYLSVSKAMMAIMCDGKNVSIIDESLWDRDETLKLSILTIANSIANGLNWRDRQNEAKLLAESCLPFYDGRDVKNLEIHSRTLAILGNIDRLKGKNEDGVIKLREAVNIMNQSPNNYDKFITLRNLGDMLFNVGMEDERNKKGNGEKMLNESFEILTECSQIMIPTFGMNHPDILICLIYLEIAKCLVDKSNSIGVIKQRMVHFQSIVGKYYEPNATLLYQIFDMLFIREEYAAGLLFLEEDINIIEKTQGRHCLHLAYCYLQMSYAYNALSNTRRALSSLWQSREIYEKCNSAEGVLFIDEQLQAIRSKNPLTYVSGYLGI